MILIGRWPTAGITICLASLVACATLSAPPPAPPSVAVSPPPAPSRSDVVTSAALAAYRGIWADVVAAGVTSDWLGCHVLALPWSY